MILFLKACLGFARKRILSEHLAGSVRIYREDGYTYRRDRRECIDRVSSYLKLKFHHIWKRASPTMGTTRKLYLTEW